MKEQRSRALRIILGWVLLEVIAAAQVGRPDGSTVLHSWLRWAASPIVWTSSQVGRFAEDVTVGLRSTRSLMRELRDLRLENQRIGAENVLLEQDIAALRAAHELLDLLPRVNGPSVLGRVSFRHLGQGRMRVRFGERQGLPRGAAAISGEGLVGRVVSQSREECWVQLITHPATAVAVRTEGGALEGLAVGAGFNRLAVEYVPKNAEITRGEMLISSGADGVFPAGIPVARVSSLRETAAAFLEVGAEPCVDLTGVGVVLLLPDWTVGPEEE